MYQENNNRKWQSPPASNPPVENLKTFLQKRIRAIMAKEWWDFIVNVNTLYSDHASLLYSLANLCPSFNYFLQSKDKELQLIVKKRPFVKPRIFSGSERVDTTPEPIVPKQLPLVTKRNSATELVKILNELYPNELASKSKQSRTYGPASKQKKTLQQGPNKKGLPTSTPSVTKKNISSNGSLGRSPLLTRLLADESQKENAHTTAVKKLANPQHSLPAPLDENKEFRNTILTNTNFDLNQIQLNKNPKKMKKIIKVKKKRYVYSNSLGDSKNRLKFILEDENPNLSLKMIKKYRIKKCTVKITRLKDSILKYYDELRSKHCENNAFTIENSPSPSILSEETAETTGQQVTGQYGTLNGIPTTQSIATPSDNDKTDEMDEKTDPQKCRKENSPQLEKFNHKDLKNMYCHGGIVPLGNVIVSDKVIDLKSSKHFLSLKEKKLKDINDSIISLLKPKETNSKSEEREMVDTNTNKRLKVSQTSESAFNKSTCDIQLENSPVCPNNSIIKSNATSITDMEGVESCDISLPHIPENRSDNILEKVTESSKILSGTRNVSENEITNFDGSISDNTIIRSSNNDARITVKSGAMKQNKSSSNRNVKLLNETSINESSLRNTENSADVVEKEIDLPLEKLQESKRNHTGSTVDQLVDTKGEPELIKNSSSENKIMLNSKNGNEELEPIAKRPRIEINLTEMKLEITKTIVDSENNQERICKICKLPFDTIESWNNHFQNNVPMCTPNLKVTWDNAQLSLLTD